MASSDLHLGLVKLGNPVPVQDLIKANANDDRRVQHLRQLLLSQLDLIQKQSEVIAAKDQQIRELKRQNENLQSQLEQHPKSSKSRKQVRILKKFVKLCLHSSNTGQNSLYFDDFFVHNLLIFLGEKIFRKFHRRN